MFLFCSIASRAAEAKSTRWAMTMPVTSEITSVRTRGTTQSGCRAMEANVSLGEKKTPAIRSKEFGFGAVGLGGESWSTLPVVIYFGSTGGLVSIRDP